MGIDLLDRVALRAIDPSGVCRLSQSQRDALTYAIVAAWLRLNAFRAYGVAVDSATYPIVSGE